MAVAVWSCPKAFGDIQTNTSASRRMGLQVLRDGIHSAKWLAGKVDESKWVGACDTGDLV
ncbi:hypothetical protein D3C78_1848680 [compost metagenome]